MRRAYVPRGVDDPHVVVAREYGFETWRELVRRRARPGEHEGQREGSPEVVAALAAIRGGDVERLRVLLDERPELADGRTPARGRRCSRRSPSPTWSATTSDPSSASIRASSSC